MSVRPSSQSAAEMERPGVELSTLTSCDWEPSLQQSHSGVRGSVSGPRTLEATVSVNLREISVAMLVPASLPPLT